jgi:hypothetical protein
MRRHRETFESMHKQCAEFEKILGDAKKLTTGIKNSTGKVLDGLSDLSKQLGSRIHYCTICFDNKKQNVTNCGHLICNLCRLQMEQANPVRCFHCRGIVTSCIKVYL